MRRKKRSTDAERTTTTETPTKNTVVPFALKYRNRQSGGLVSIHKKLKLLVIVHIITLIAPLTTVVATSLSFNGIPAAFGDLDLNKRTDIVAIGDDGGRIDIYYQHQRQTQPLLELGFSCRSDWPVVQVYLADIDSDGNPNILPLVLTSVEKSSQEKIYSLKGLKVKYIDQNTPPYTTKLTSTTTYSLATAAALNSDGSVSNISSIGSNSSNINNTLVEPLPLKSKPPNCEFSDLGVEMKAQPLLFDFEGDLRTDFMSLDTHGEVTVWRPPKHGSNSELFEKMPTKEWSFIKREYFSEPHSNSFIDINHDNAADIVLSSDGNVAYLLADPDPSKSFKSLHDLSKNFRFDVRSYIFGQSSLVDIDADGRIDHVIPRCAKYKGNCDIMVLYGNGHVDFIFKFDNRTEKGPNHYYDYRLESDSFGENYLFPITLRASDLDGDGYTDFVAIARNNIDSKNKVVYLHNIPDHEHSKRDNFTSGHRAMSRTFEIVEIPFSSINNQNLHLVTLFDINEDGKVDMLVGASEHSARPDDMNISAIMNTQMVDACFMKVLVTNGFYSAEAGSNGQSARGPLICFELSQNDGNKMQGCAGQLSSSSHFALQQPYVIFGLGQTPHFVETLNVSIPGFGTDRRVRTRLIEQIVPDAQVIIIPRQKDNPNSWDFKMFLSPMSDLVFSTLIALAVLCLIILFIIFILHRQETLEDAAEHEEYKRHWPESR